MGEAIAREKPVKAGNRRNQQARIEATDPLERDLDAVNGRPYVRRRRSRRSGGTAYDGGRTKRRSEF